MKHYSITVNGTAYDVTVEETAGGACRTQDRPCCRTQSCRTRGGPCPPAAAGAVKVTAPCPAPFWM